MSDPTLDAPTPARRLDLAGLLVAGLFALLYAYDLWEAVSNLVELPVVYQALGLDAARLPWWLLIVGVLVPPLVFVLALAAGRRRSIGARALLLLLGLAIVAGLSLGVIALEFALRSAPA